MRNDPWTVGDSVDFEDEIPDYPPSDGWTLRYRLVPRFTSPSQDAIVLTATGTDAVYRTQVGPTESSLWASGWYTWTRWVEKAGARWSDPTWTGDLFLRPDPATTTAGYDGRSQAQKAVDDLKAALATYTASHGTVSEYSIAGRSMRFRSADEILKLLSFWKIELAREEAAAGVKSGLADSRRIYLRAGRA